MLRSRAFMFNNPSRSSRRRHHHHRSLPLTKEHRNFSSSSSSSSSSISHPLIEPSLPALDITIFIVVTNLSVLSRFLKKIDQNPFVRSFCSQMVVGIFPSCSNLSMNPFCSNYPSRQKAFRRYGRGIRRACIRRPRTSAFGEAVGSRVFVLSDLHTDYSENMTWVKSISTERHKNDVLLVAGDVSETCKTFVLTMSLLKDRFEHVFYVPGNHDLWCRWEGEEYIHSLEKLNVLLDSCKGLGVLTHPLIIDGLGIIPLFSWYHESFDKENDIAGLRIPSLDMACKDFHACKWPEELSNRDASLSIYFDAMNENNQYVVKEIQRTCSQIITFSHFLPRQELCPEKRMLFYPNLPKIIGSDCLEDRIRSIHGVEGSPSACHVFGHTHFCWDSVLDGIRYVQAPLAYPRERKRRINMNGGEDWLPFCIYSGGKFAERLPHCPWSDYYDVNPREPHNTQLAPWVARFYGQT